MAGQVYLFFGDGLIGGEIDLAASPSEVLTIIGEAPSEATGNELRIADVTGDGLGDLVIARQNYRATAPDRIGAGALTVVVGGAALRGVLQSGGVLDLGAPPDGIALFTLVGPSELGRLGMFVRTGDVTGDGVDDIVVGADQEGDAGEQHRGAMYVVRGGAHLAASETIDLADFGSTSATGHIAKIEPPSGRSAEYHFGATVEVGDLDGNGRAEVLGAAALIRGGGAFLADGAPPGSAHGGGGADNGRVYIVWDENFVGDTWAAGYTIQLDDADHLITLVQGGTLETRVNSTLGEEMVAGGDYNGDGRLDLFLGDMRGSPTDERPTAGIAYVIYSAADLKQFRQVQVNEPPELLYVTVFLGPLRESSWAILRFKLISTAMVTRNWQSRRRTRPRGNATRPAPSTFSGATANAGPLWSICSICRIRGTSRLPICSARPGANLAIVETCWLTVQRWQISTEMDCPI